MTIAPVKKDPTAAERTERYRAKGRFVGVLIRNGEALEALEALELEHKSLAGAINAALLHYQETKLDPAYSKAAEVLRHNKEAPHVQAKKNQPRR